MKKAVRIRELTSGRANQLVFVIQEITAFGARNSPSSADLQFGVERVRRLAIDNV